jgi:hypothetical protein
MNRLLLLGLCAVGISTAGCDKKSVLVEVTFEDDGTSSIPVLDGYVQTPPEDLNLSVAFEPDYIIIPTGVAVPVRINGFYVEVSGNENEADADLSDPRTPAPSDEVLSAASQNSAILGVKIVDNQITTDTRARWVVFGVQEGFTAFTVEGSESIGTVVVPAHVVFQ